MKTRLIPPLLTTLALLAAVDAARAQNTAFTYQGRLNSGAAPATGSFDLRFTLYDAASAGNAVGSPLIAPATAISNGLFIASLNFGVGAFTGADRWLELAVRTNGVGVFTALAPRQPLAATPYAQFATRAGTAASASNATAVAANTVNTAALATNSITSAKIAAGQVVKSLNGLMDVVNLTAGANVILTTNGNALRIAAAAVGGTNAWLQGGNAGTTAGLNFVGTADSQPLEFKVNQQRVARFEMPVANQPNFIGGSAGNVVSNAVATTIAGGFNQRAASSFATIGGGADNLASGWGSTIAGGRFNKTLLEHSSVGGGFNNLANGAFAAVGGGADNAAQGFGSTIAGGRYNVVSNEHSAVGGGIGNSALGFDSVVGGGENNTAGGNYSVLAGGQANYLTANSPWSFLGGGGYNTVQDAWNAVLGGGWANTILPGAQYATIVGGHHNTNGGYSATIPGGDNNLASGSGSFAAGHRARSLHQGSFVWADSTEADFTSTLNNQFLIRASGGVGIGTANPQAALDVAGTVRATSLTLASGVSANSVLASDAAGGAYWQSGLRIIPTFYFPCEFCVGQPEVPNLVVGYGGNFTSNGVIGATILGGGILGRFLTPTEPNSAGGSYATVAGGGGNEANGYLSFAAGHRAKARHRGSFVWADSQNADFASVSNNQFLVRAQGGVGINTTATPDAALTVNGHTHIEDYDIFFRAGADRNHGVGWYQTFAGTNVDGPVLYGWAGGVLGTTAGGENWALAWNNAGDVRMKQMSVEGVATVKVLDITGGSDVAEPFPMKEDAIEPGSVVVIDDEHPGRLKLSQGAYDTRVAGVVSGANGVQPGLSLRQAGVLEQGKNVALTGRVYVKADAASGAIQPGDLITTSDTPGHAMKAADRERRSGAILGKAMTSLAAGQGFVLVLVSLQ